LAKLSAEQKSEIATLRERGWSYERIANKFKVTPTTAHYHCLMLGAVSPRTRAVTDRGPMVMVRKDGKVQRRFTDEEDAELQRRRAANETIASISKAMKRAPTSVRMRIAHLELREEGYARA